MERASLRYPNKDLHICQKNLVACLCLGGGINPLPRPQPWWPPPPTGSLNSSRHVMYLVNPLHWGHYGHPSWQYPCWAGLLIRLRGKVREGLAVIYGGRQLNLSPTNGRRDGICHCSQQLHLSELMHNASECTSVSWFGSINIIFSL